MNLSKQQNGGGERLGIQAYTELVHWLQRNILWLDYRRKDHPVRQNLII